MSRARFDPVRIGVVGLGFFGSRHAETLAGLAEAELVAVCARRQASIGALDELGLGTTGWTDLEEAIEESGAEAWVVAASTAAHIAITRTLLGKRVTDRSASSWMGHSPLSTSVAIPCSSKSLTAPSSTHSW